MSGVFLKATGSFCPFLTKCLPNTRLSIFSLSFSCYFVWAWCSVGGGDLLVRLQIEPLAVCLPLHSRHTGQCVFQVLMCTCCFIPQYITKQRVQGSRWRTHVHFRSFIKDVLMWNWLFPQSAWRWGRQWCSVQSVPLPCVTRRCHRFMHLCLCISPVSVQWKPQQPFSMVIKQCWCPGYPERFLSGPTFHGSLRAQLACGISRQCGWGQLILICLLWGRWTRSSFSAYLLLMLSS